MLCYSAVSLCFDILRMLASRLGDGEHNQEPVPHDWTHFSIAQFIIFIHVGVLLIIFSVPPCDGFFLINST